MESTIYKRQVWSAWPSLSLYFCAAVFHFKLCQFRCDQLQSRARVTDFESLVVFLLPEGRADHTAECVFRHLSQLCGRFDRALSDPMDEAIGVPPPIVEGRSLYYIVLVCVLLMGLRLQFSYQLRIRPAKSPPKHQAASRGFGLYV